MPYRILEKTRLNSAMCKAVIEAPLAAENALSGQFVMVKIDDRGERIPLTINDYDKKNGTVTIIFQEAGTTTKKLSCLKTGDSIQDLLGPLGKPVNFGRAGKVALVAGGIGIAEILPIAKYARANSNFVLTILGAKTKELLILEEELKALSDKLIITTNDGSYGIKGLVIDPLKDALSEGKIDLCYAVGPDIMMKAVCEVTKACRTKTLVSLDANMVDATGMCGTCRVTVGGKTQFVCVDGPEFDGHLVDWDGFMKRQKRFIGEEKRSLEMLQFRHKECVYKAKDAGTKS